MQTEFPDDFFSGVLRVKAYLCCFTQFTVDRSKLTVNGSVLPDTPKVRYQARVTQRERFNVVLRSAFLTICNNYASKKRFFVTVRCAVITFLFKICIHINRFVALCLCNGSFHILLSARLLKNSFVAVRGAIL